MSGKAAASGAKRRHKASRSGSLPASRSASMIAASSPSQARSWASANSPTMGAARPLLGVGGQQRLEGALIGTAREELLAIDQVEQSHRLAAQGMDDMPVIDDLASLAAGMRATATQAHPRRRTQQAFAPVFL